MNVGELILTYLLLKLRNSFLQSGFLGPKYAYALKHAHDTVFLSLAQSVFGGCWVWSQALDSVLMHLTGI